MLLNLKKSLRKLQRDWHCNFHYRPLMIGEYDEASTPNRKFVQVWTWNKIDSFYGEYTTLFQFCSWNTLRGSLLDNHWYNFVLHLRECSCKHHSTQLSPIQFSQHHHSIIINVNGITIYENRTPVLNGTCIYLLF